MLTGEKSEELFAGYLMKVIDTSPTILDIYPDFWRLTHEGLQQLFSHFDQIEVVPLGGPIEFRLEQFYLAKYFKVVWVRKLIDWIDRPQLGKTTARPLILAKN